MITVSSVIGKNEDLIPSVLNIYAKEGNKIADVTYGNGNFWKNVDMSLYHIFGSDIKKDLKYGAIADFNHLPYPDCSMDIVVFDPPYMHGSPAPIKEEYDKTYKNRLFVFSGVFMILFFFLHLCKSSYCMVCELGRDHDKMDYRVCASVRPNQIKTRLEIPIQR